LRWPSTVEITLGQQWSCHADNGATRTRPGGRNLRLGITGSVTFDGVGLAGVAVPDQAQWPPGGDSGPGPELAMA
ncbi:MAG: hypothetical protein ACRDRO_11145, partial [Pseudonocardiaceae bacterium]